MKMIITEGQYITTLEKQVAELESINAELLARLELASKYVAKMVADGIETALSPEVALSRIAETIRKAKATP